MVFDAAPIRPPVIAAPYPACLQDWPGYRKPVAPCAVFCDPLAANTPMNVEIGSAPKCEIEGQPNMADVKPTARKTKARGTKKAPAAPVPDKPSMATEKAAGFRIKDLIDRVTASSGAKRSVVKPIIEATLHALGQALDTGENLTLPPLGRAKVSRSKELAGGAMLTIKLRRSASAKPGTEGDDETLAAVEKSR